MSNTVTNLIPDLYEALDVVSRELTGMIASVSRDSSLERAAKDQVIRSFVAPASSSVDIAPAQLPPDTGDQTFGNKTITISKAKAIPMRWDGEQQKGINSGAGYQNLRRDQMAQAMRSLTNEMEADLCALYTGASRAQAPTGTNLFDANLKDLAKVRKILVDNGAPPDDVSVIINTGAGADMRGLGQLNHANQAADTSLLRQGVLLDIFGMGIRESAGIKTHTAGSGTSYVINGSHAIGATSIVIKTGSGTVVAGDVVVFEDDANKYVVTTGAASAGTIVIAAPGLKKAQTDGKTMTIDTASLDRNIVLARNAMHFITRIPARPLEGDSAVDIVTVQDPRSGLAFEFSMYKEYRRVHFEMSAAWGMAVIKPEHMALLID